MTVTLNPKLVFNSGVLNENGGGGGDGGSGGDVPSGYDVSDGGWDIVIVAGQSNAVNFSGSSGGTNDSIDQFIDWDDSRIYQWSYNGGVKMVSGTPTLDSDYALKLLKAHEPLRFPKIANEVWVTRFGPCAGTSFARNRLLDIPPNRNILLIPMAFPGVGLVNSYWQAIPPLEGSLFTATVVAATAAVNTLRNARVTDIVWIQGENEAQTNPASISPSQYEDGLVTMIEEMRSQIPTAENARFYCGSMVPEWIEATIATTQSEDIDAVHRRIPRLVSNAWYIPGPRNAYINEGGNPADNIHYNNVGGREHGRRMSVKARAMDAITSAADLTVPEDLIVNGPSILFKVPTSDAPLYQVRYRSAGSSDPWTELDFSPYNYAEPGDTVEFTFTFLTEDIDVQVAAVYGDFVGPFTPVVTVDYITVPQPLFDLDFENATVNVDTQVFSVPSLGTDTTAWTPPAGKEPLRSTVNGKKVLQTVVLNSILRGPGIPNGPYSFYLLVNHLDFTGTGCYLCDTNSLTSYLLWRGGDNKVDVGHAGNGAAVVANTAMSANRWYGIGVVFDPTEPTNKLKLYIDGMLDNQANGSATLPGSSSTSLNEVLNSANNGNRAQYQMVKAWTSALSAQQMAQVNSIAKANLRV